MYHYIYKTISESGLYYIGRHSTNNINDNYIGSGTWVRKYKDKSKLQKVILEYCETFDDLLEKEKRFIEDCLDDPLNMNFNNSSIGAATGERNIAHRKEVKEKHKRRMTENNPMKGKTPSEKTKDKIRQSLLGPLNPFYGKTHSIETKERISQKNSGKVWTDEQRTRLSEVRKKQFDNTKPSYLIFEKHTEESKDKIRQSALSRAKVECPHCKKLISPHVAKRWHFDNCKGKAW
jgi:hypothetical protein